MDSTHSTGAEPKGLARDFARIKSGSTATAAELREFIGALKGKRPQEVMGLVAGSSLVQCTTLATIVTAVFMAAFTVGPYVWYKVLYPPTPVTAQAPAAAPAKTELPATTAAPTNAAPNTASAPAKNDAPIAKGDATKSSMPTPSGDPLEPSTANKQKALEKLGIGETKSSDPKKNPLENSADDLLKDLK